MALIVEDGTVVANANSYISLADANTYHSDRLHSETWSAATNAEKEAALKMATFWLDTKIGWKGCKTDEDSALRWPRTGVYDQDSLCIDSNEIPNAVKAATAELARYFLDEDRTAESGTAGISEVEAGPISIKLNSFAQQGLGQGVFPRSVMAIVAPFGYVISGSRVGHLRRS